VLTCTVLLALGAATVSARGDKAGPSASIIEFGPDLIGTDDGLPTKPGSPLRHGPPAVTVDAAGNAVDAHQGKLAYFRGRYWWYGDAYRFGYRFQIPGVPLGGGSNAGFCGFATSSSPDLQHWQEQPLALTSRLRELCGVRAFAEPRVVYSRALHRYLMCFLADAPGHYSVAQSTRPDGPWSAPAPASVAHPAAGDFDVYVDHLGRGWLVVANLDFASPANDARYVERLNAELTACTGEQVEVASGPREAPSLFQRGTRYYLTVSDPICAYCQTATGVYAADDPLGPWRSATGTPSTIISPDSCGGQPRAVSELPAPDGPLYLLQIDLWRTSPFDFGPLGDRNQAVAGRYWVPLRFTAEGTVEPITCQDRESVPLAGNPGRRGAARVYELDCRARAGSSMLQQWTVPPHTTISALSVAVFQRPRDNADMTRPLEVEMRAGGRVIGARTLLPAAVSWSPREVDVPLSTRVAGGQPVQLRLASQEENGCYGVSSAPTRDCSTAATPPAKRPSPTRAPRSGSAGRQR
jgi:Glycosyl hydrolases family 43